MIDKVKVDNKRLSGAGSTNTEVSIIVIWTKA